MQDLYSHIPPITLLPCPFCSGEAKVDKVGSRVRVYCSVCLCSHGIYPEEFAYDKWQKREYLQELADLRNRLGVLQYKGLA